MTYTEKFTKLKDFNPARLEQEVDALNLPEGTTIWFMGFDEKDEDTVAPADLMNPRVVIKTPQTEPVAVISEATKGDVHFMSYDKLTARQVADIEEKLDAHNATAKSLRQLAVAAKRTDLATLQAKMAGAGVTAGDLQLMARLLLEALA